MLVPKNSAIALVVSPITSGNGSAIGPFADCMHRLTAVGNVLHVPVIVARFQSVVSEKDVLADIKLDGVRTSLPFHPKPEDWAATDLGRALAAESRSQIIVGGFWLEEAVTLLALNCLAVGYDTFVVGDATAMLDSDHELATRARLAQAGAVPTSTDQVIREWTALHDDPTYAFSVIAELAHRDQDSP